MFFHIIFHMMFSLFPLTYYIYLGSFCNIVGFLILFLNNFVLFPQKLISPLVIHGSLLCILLLFLIFIKGNALSKASLYIIMHLL